MSDKIIDAILGLNFDDSLSTTGAATLFYVIANDVSSIHNLWIQSHSHLATELAEEQSKSESHLLRVTAEGGVLLRETATKCRSE
ncbi:hypothetical protein KSP40_PGU013405 [Platanthera guangdongensis]|uniref:Uncharacterized protein n=1 Tax=Platanthera guangdongensis TaxID=2320717 RepID=A0ABR2MK80_9ASPA